MKKMLGMGQAGERDCQGLTWAVDRGRRHPRQQRVPGGPQSAGRDGEMGARGLRERTREVGLAAPVGASPAVPGTRAAGGGVLASAARVTPLNRPRGGSYNAVPAANGPRRHYGKNEHHSGKRLGSPIEEQTEKSIR